jgi:hypothetical protein
MKKAGDILAAFFDEKSLNKAKGYGSFFSSWAALLEKCGLSQAVSHSKIANLERSVLLIEADHPGWIQILQTKQKELLETARRSFPGITLAGISFRLSREPFVLSPETGDSQTLAGKGDSSAGPVSSVQTEDTATIEADEAPEREKLSQTIESIGDEKLREGLKRLEQSIRERNTNRNTPPR